MSDKPKIIVLKRPIKNCPHCGGKCDVDVFENQTFYKPYYPCKKCSKRVYNMQMPYDKKGREIFGCSRTCEMKMYEDFEDGKECNGFVNGDSVVCWP